VAAGQVLMYIRRSSLTPEIHFICFFITQHPTGVPGSLGLLMKRKITLVLCIWQVAIMLICVCLDVQVHRGGCRPGSNVHTEADSHIRIPRFFFCLDSASNRRSCLLGLLSKRLITFILYIWQVAIMFICVYLDVQVHRGGCRPGSNVHTEVESHTRNPFFCFCVLYSAPNRRAWLLGLLIKHKITLVLYICQVAIMFICVYLDVRVHRGGCQPGSNVHTEVDSHTRNPLCFVFYYSASNRRLVAWCLVCSLNARSRNEEGTESSVVWQTSG
jgi:hypothetical protein